MLKIARGMIKALALIGGALVTIVSLMALTGAHTPSGWLRASVALVVALGVPLVVVERILAGLPPGDMKGVTTDVLAVCYVGFALAFVGVAHGYSQPLLRREAGRLERAGLVQFARATYVLAGGHGVPPPPVTPAPIAPSPVVVDPPKPASAEATVPAPGAGDRKERTPAQIFTEFAPSVVTITIKGPRGEGGGTGFVIDAAGTVATNHHVIDQATQIAVKLIDGTVADDVEILAEDQPHDLALLHIKTRQQILPLILGDSDAITVGERAVSIGNPLGLDHTLTDGLVSSRRLIEGRKMIQMSAPISPGNSGGPLFNSHGEVIGVSSATYGAGWQFGQNLNLAVPINDLRGMIRSDYPGRHKVGESSSSAGRW